MVVWWINWFSGVKDQASHTRTWKTPSKASRKDFLKIMEERWPSEDVFINGFLMELRQTFTVKVIWQLCGNDQTTLLYHGLWNMAPPRVGPCAGPPGWRAVLLPPALWRCGPLWQFCRPCSGWLKLGRPVGRFPWSTVPCVDQGNHQRNCLYA